MTEAYVHQIMSHLGGLGVNFAPIPFAISYESKEWTVFLDVRISRETTFDIESRSPQLNQALKKALKQLRRAS